MLEREKARLIRLLADAETFDDEAGETRYFAEAVDEDTGKMCPVNGDDGP